MKGSSAAPPPRKLNEMRSHRSLRAHSFKHVGRENVETGWNKMGRNGTILFSANNEHPADNIWGIENDFRNASVHTPTYFCDWSNNSHALYICMSEAARRRRAREITKPANRATVPPLPADFIYRRSRFHLGMTYITLARKTLTPHGP